MLHVMHMSKDLKGSHGNLYMRGPMVENVSQTMESDNMVNSLKRQHGLMLRLTGVVVFHSNSGLYSNLACIVLVFLGCEPRGLEVLPIGLETVFPMFLDFTLNEIVENQSDTDNSPEQPETQSSRGSGSGTIQFCQTFLETTGVQPGLETYRSWHFKIHRDDQSRSRGNSATVQKSSPW